MPTEIQPQRRHQSDNEAGNENTHRYHTLANILSARHTHNQTLEIEILPSSLSLGLGPFVHDGCCVGIAKKALVQAFVVARRLFLDHPDRNCYDDEKLLRATEILILFASEHTTACSWRKRRLVWMLQGLKSAGCDGTGDSGGCNFQQKALDTLDKEVTLTTTYLTSRLHRHVKSSTLWQHRLWVLRHKLAVRCLPPPPQTPHEKGKPESELQTLLHTELSVVLRASEFHPRNYYAFSYMRQLYTFLLRSVHETQCQNISTSLLDRTISWCQANPRDISGWMFALYILKDNLCYDVQMRVIEGVVRFALNIGWVGESLWTFVDLAVRYIGIENLDGSVRVALQVSEVDLGTNAAGSWKTWLARAEAYWAAGHVMDSQSQT